MRTITVTLLVFAGVIVPYTIQIESVQVYKTTMSILSLILMFLAGFVTREIIKNYYDVKFSKRRMEMMEKWDGKPITPETVVEIIRDTDDFLLEVLSNGLVKPPKADK